MEQNPIFVENPQLKVVYGTSDGEFFYNRNDAQNHAKNLSDKKVEPVYNTNHLEVTEEEVLEETAEEETAADTTAVDTTAADTTAVDTTAADTTAVDTTAADTTAVDTTAVDTTAVDTTAVDTTAADTTAADTTAADTTAADTTAADTTAVESSSLEDRLRAFNPESIEYAEALDLFIDLKLVAASRKKVDVYAALSAAQSQLK